MKKEFILSNRALAMLLAVAMVLTSFQGMSLTSYAAEENAQTSEAENDGDGGVIPEEMNNFGVTAGEGGTTSGDGEGTTSGGGEGGYRGDIYSVTEWWYDEETGTDQETEIGKGLYLNHYALDTENYKQQVLDILASYAEQEEKFLEVKVAAPKNATTISQTSFAEESEVDKDIYNAAAALVNADGGRGVYFKFEDEQGYRQWAFAGGQEMTKNVTLKYTMDLPVGGAPTIKFNLADLPAGMLVNLDVSLRTEMETPDPMLAELNRKFEFGRTYTLSPIEKVSVYFDWQDRGQEQGFFLNNVGTLTNDTTYTIGQLFGNMDENGYLHINAWELNKETFEAGDLARVLSSRIEAKEKYSVVHVHQEYTENNKLSKADVNVLRQLLDMNGEGRLTYIFHRDETIVDENGEPLKDENGNPTGETWQDELYFSLIRPGTAAKDINANVVLNYLDDGQGVTLKVPANTYAAEDVTVDYYTNGNTQTGKALVKSLGENGTRPAILKKVNNELTWELLLDASYDIYEYEDGNGRDINLWVDIAGMTANTEHQLIIPKEIDPITVKAVPEEFKEILKKDKDAVFTSYATDIATVAADGTVNPLNNNGEVLLSASYKDGSTEKFEVFRTWTEIHLTQIKFNKKAIKMELSLGNDENGNEVIKIYHDEDQENPTDFKVRDYVSVNYYPSNASADRDDANLLWEVGYYNEAGEFIAYTEENGNIEDAPIQMIPDDDGICRGNFGALRAGEAVVRATYIMDRVVNENEEEEIILNEDLRAECKVTVTEPVTIPREAWDGAYVVTNFGETLADVILPVYTPEPEENPEEGISQIEEGGAAEGWSWKWVNPETSLKDYKGMNNYEFPAIFTAADGRTRDVYLNVRMVTLEGIEMFLIEPKRDEQGQIIPNEAWDDCGYVPSHMDVDSEKIFNYRLLLRNGEEWEVWQYLEDENLKAKYPVQFVWNVDKGMSGLKYSWRKPGTEAAEGELTIPGWDDSFGIKAAADTKRGEKKTVTLEMQAKNAKGEFKTIFSDKASIHLLKNETLDWEYVIDNAEDIDKLDSIRPGDPAATVTFIQKPGEEFKITAKSSDSAVMKITGTQYETKTEEIDGETVTRQYTTVSYEIKKAGTAMLRLTANDEIKSWLEYTIYIADSEPIVDTSDVVINSKATSDYKLRGITVPNGFEVTGFEVVNATELSGKISVTEGGGNDGNPNNDSLTFRLLDKTEKAKTYTVQVKITTSNKNLLAAYHAEMEEAENASYEGVEDPEGAKQKAINTIEEKYGFFSYTEIEEDYTKVFKVKVIDTLPKITFKQTEKVNLFYNAKDKNGNPVEEHFGYLTVNTGDAVLAADLKIKDDANSKFKLDKVEENLYQITYTGALYAKLTSADKKVTLIYTAANEYGTFAQAEKTFSIGTENKKPTLVVSPAKLTLYPKQDYGYSNFDVSEKGTGTPVDFTKAELVVNKRNGEYRVVGDQPGENENYNPADNATDDVKVGKNNYHIEKYEYSWWNDELGEEGGEDIAHGISLYLRDNAAAKSGTDKFTFRLTNPDWTQPIEVSHSVTVNLKTPKLKLGASKLTLNKNDEVYEGQSAETSLTLTGGVAPDNVHTVIVGKDTKSAAILNNQLILNYDSRSGKIWTALNTDAESNQTLEAGTYKYKINVIDNNNKFNLTTDISIIIKDTESSKCVKVSKKGSIDVLRRDTTYIEYSAKLSNLPAGRIVGGYVTGKDERLFYGEFNHETGKLEVRAYDWATLSTKINYEINPVFEVECEDGRRYNITAGAQKIKVTQGKPKVTFNGGAKTATLYRQAGNWLEIPVSAVLKGENITIQDIYLLNYNGDLYVTSGEEDKDGNYFNYVEDGWFYLSADLYSTDKITTTGKTWNVKFGVVFQDQAGNVKDTVVSYKIVVR